MALTVQLVLSRGSPGTGGTVAIEGDTEGLGVIAPLISRSPNGDVLMWDAGQSVWR